MEYARYLKACPQASDNREVPVPNGGLSTDI